MNLELARGLEAREARKAPRNFPKGPDYAGRRPMSRIVFANFKALGLLEPRSSPLSAIQCATEGR